MLWIILKDNVSESCSRRCLKNFTYLHTYKHLCMDCSFFIFLTIVKSFVKKLFKRLKLLGEVVLKLEKKLILFPKTSWWHALENSGELLKLRLLQSDPHCLTSITDNSACLISYGFLFQLRFPPGNIKQRRQRSNALRISWRSFSAHDKAGAIERVNHLLPSSYSCDLLRA